LLSYKVKKKSTRSYYGLEGERTRKEEERMKHGGLKKNKKRDGGSGMRRMLRMWKILRMWMIMR